MAVLTVATLFWKNRVINRLKRRQPDNREDLKNSLIVDSVADLILAARCEGFTSDEIKLAINKAAHHAACDWREEAGPIRSTRSAL